MTTLSVRALAFYRSLEARRVGPLNVSPVRKG